jgi:GNAT superfamily N-acetyltransferase
MSAAGVVDGRIGRMDVEVTAEPEQMPAPMAVEHLLAAAAGGLGPGEAAALAAASARMYSWARAIPGAATVAAHEAGELVGFGYGYSWDWASLTDAWSLRLRDDLGPLAAALDDSFSVVLVVVDPSARRHGLGATLLRHLAEQADEPATWLQTVTGSGTAQLCGALGWQALDDPVDPLIMLGRRD